MAIATSAIERGLITVADDLTTLIFDTVSGPVVGGVSSGVGAGAWARADEPDSGARLARAGPPGCRRSCWQPAATVKLPGRVLKVDIAFGGAFYAIVDAEAAGRRWCASGFSDLRELNPADCRRGRAAACDSCIRRSPASPG